MAKRMAQWPTEHSQFIKIRVSGDRKDSAVPLAVELEYNFREIRDHPGNAG